ncbi:hypothetical protein ACVGVM_01425 [Pseudonocardia bannensis]|uniref:GAF domain-containing protein n=1 Tax=Pseudonocardia bannensis TaxID=630973 RepID=A0A848DDK1_9PSEU|nr:hypothetical protein [Pseudonocardia bannensis]NMH90653.1 hypothetical protein [Pseudonocardia bannensis]
MADVVTHALTPTRLLLELDGDELRVIAQRGFERPLLEFFDLVADEGSACGIAMNRTRRVVVRDVEQSSVFRGIPAGAIMLDAGVRAVRPIPLIGSSGRRPLGVFSTHHRRPGSRTPANRVLSLLAHRAAAWLESVDGTRPDDTLGPA